jgi:hypothetical protein
MRQPKRAIVLAATSLAGWLCLATSARADAIDGEWCLGSSVFLIDGSRIVTPGRNTVEGQYNRYRFAYTVPTGEPGAGSEIRMVMIRGQELVHLTRAGQTGDPEVWRRCKPIS